VTVFLGLTGSIGMGKSTTAQMFRDFGIPVHDSDAVVHELYRGEAAAQIEAEFSGTTRNGMVDRALLSKQVVGDEAAMKRLEAIVHPLVRQAEDTFRSKVSMENRLLAILDIPLLFETGGECRVDGIIVVTAPADIQRQRVLEREGMSRKKFEAILKRQVPDLIKRENATYIIDTSKGMSIAQRCVQEIIQDVEKSSTPTAIGS